MQIFGIEITSDMSYIFALVVIIFVAIMLHGFKYVEHEPFTSEEECQQVGTYVIEKCGNSVKGYMRIPDMDTKSPTNVSKILPTAATPKNECPFPLEPHEIGCQLKCPTSKFLLANPNIVCQKIISGEITVPTDDTCPDGYKKDPAGCVKALTQCPPNFELIEGSCQEKCPDGSTSEFMEAEVDNNGFVEKKNIKVCRSKPLAAANLPVDANQPAAANQPVTSNQPVAPSQPVA
jgi:hypothetical protein